MTAAALPSAARTWSLGLLPIMFRRHFSLFKTYVRRDLGLAVLLNPKVGSSAFRKILVEGLQLTGQKPILSRLWPLKLDRRYLIAPPTDYLDALLHPRRYEFYCFVRNPYSRLLSSWKDKFAFHHAENSYPRGVQPLVPQIRRFAEEHELPGGAAGSEIPFATFIAFVRSQAEGTRNHHWDTQRSVLFTDAIRYERIYRMETEFAAGMTKILARLGLPRDWIAEKLKLPVNKGPQLASPAYTAELAEQVHKIYEGDFELFAYDRDSWRGL